MIRVQGIKMKVGQDIALLKQTVAAHLSIREEEISSFSIVRQSIDARKKNDLSWIYTVDLESVHEDRILKKRQKQVAAVSPREAYQMPPVVRKSKHRPVIIGFGPAGIFAAWILARAGLCPIVLERGQDVDARDAAIMKFWRTGQLDENSNVQFGEGGAGTFSDGKLTTGTHDSRIAAVVDAFIAAGAPPEIAFSHKPHIGTDRLRVVIKQMRTWLIEMGCEIRFAHRMVNFSSECGQISAVHVAGAAGEYRLETDTVILAPGHSARDTFSLLRDGGVTMVQKPFAIGVRAEHLQADIGMAQYGAAFDALPPTDYKLSCHLPNGRSVFSFCVCPGGQVVAAASEQGHLVTNGMSYYARDGKNCNGALLVNVNPSDFASSDVLAGVSFQRKWERAAFLAGGGGYHAPAQMIRDFLRDVPSSKGGGVIPTYAPQVHWTSLESCLPDYISESLRLALPLFQQKVKGFCDGDGVLTGIETRSSSPVRILRDEKGMANLRGLYPCGEGAGYAGGIISAAVDGIRVAEFVLQQE